MVKFYDREGQFFNSSAPIQNLLKKLLYSVLAPAIVGVFCLSSIVVLQMPRARQLTESRVNSIEYKKEEKIEKVNLELLERLPSFGFDNLVANWTMLGFIQYYGDGEARKYTGYSLSPDYLEVTTKNDPRFISAYLIMSPASSINAGRPKRTVALMQQGLKQLSPHIPNAYFIWLYKGIDELLFLGDIEAAKQSYLMAANWAKIAGDNNIAIAAQNTVQFLSTNPDSKKAQVGAWFMVFVNSTDRETRQLAKNKIEELGGTLIVEPDGEIYALPPKQD